MKMLDNEMTWTRSVNGTIYYIALQCLTMSTHLDYKRPAYETETLVHVVDRTADI